MKRHEPPACYARNATCQLKVAGATWQWLAAAVACTVNLLQMSPLTMVSLVWRLNCTCAALARRRRGRPRRAGGAD